MRGRFRFEGEKEAAGTAVEVRLVGIMDIELRFVIHLMPFGAPSSPIVMMTPPTTTKRGDDSHRSRCSDPGVLDKTWVVVPSCSNHLLTHLYLVWQN